MSASDAAITGATVIVPLIDAAGAVRNVSIRALKDRQIVELDEWVRNRIMRVAVSSLSGVPPALHDKIIDRAIATAVQASYISSEGLKAFNCIDGIAQLLFCSALPGQITYDELRELFTNVANVSVASKMFQLVNSGSIAVGDEKKVDATPTAEEKSTTQYASSTV
jgi:hypothetical protein